MNWYFYKALFTHRQKQGVELLPHVCVFVLADIIDENLKTALQKELNVMAPGLTIQVFHLLVYTSVCDSLSIYPFTRMLWLILSHVSDQSSISNLRMRTSLKVDLHFLFLFLRCQCSDKGCPCHKAKDPRVYQEELWTHVSVKIYFLVLPTER